MRILKARLPKEGASLSSAWGPWVHGFRPGHQAAEVAVLLRTLMCRAIEWKMPLAVAKLDISKAYDSILVSQIFRKLQLRSDINQDILHAMLAQTLDAEAVFELQGVRSLQVTKYSCVWWDLGGVRLPNLQVTKCSCFMY